MSIAVSCSAFEFVAVCRSVLKRVAVSRVSEECGICGASLVVCSSGLHFVAVGCNVPCSVLQWIAFCCSGLQYVAVWCQGSSAVFAVFSLKYAAVRRSALLQCVAVRCRKLQCQWRSTMLAAPRFSTALQHRTIPFQHLNQFYFSVAPCPQKAMETKHSRSLCSVIGARHIKWYRTSQRN